MDESIGWGYQIRSYVLHPYQMIKDLRTGLEVGNTKSAKNADVLIYDLKVQGGSFSYKKDVINLSYDVEEVIAQLLVTEGFSTVDYIAKCDVSDLAYIEGFEP